MNDEIELFTGLFDKERKQVLKWAFSLPEEKVVSIFQDSVRKYYQLKHEHPLVPGRLLRYSAFILQARCAGWDTLQRKGYRVAGEKQFLDFSEIRRAKAASIIRKGRNPVLRKKLLAFWGEINELKQEGIGFRPISAYLLKHRKIKVSPTYLAKLWQEVATTRIVQEESVIRDECLTLNSDSNCI